MPDLKPCPFCGGKASRRSYDIARQAVRCFKCPCTGTPHYTANEAIAAWNRRAVEDVLAEALEPFARFACDEPHVDEPPCHNCRAREALRKTAGRDTN